MLGTGELLVLLLVVLILFGGKRLPELARSIGLGIREFKKACHGIDDVDDYTVQKGSKKESASKDVETVTIEVEPENKNH